MKKYNWLFWICYIVAASACWASTYQVFLASDTPIVAALAASSVDITLVLTLYIMGKVKGDQRNVALIGTLCFALISAVAQIIQRFTGLGVDMPPALKVVSLFLVPASTTGAVVLLGLLKYFDRDSNGIPDFMEKGRNRGNQNQSQQSSQQIRQAQHSPAIVPSNFQPPLETGQGNGHSNGSGVREFSNTLPAVGELRRTEPFPIKPQS